MAAYTALIDHVTDIVKANLNEEINGTNMQEVLIDMVATLGAEQLRGIATPLTNPGVPPGYASYLATEAGAYSNFAITIPTAGLYFLHWNVNTYVWDVTEIPLPISYWVRNAVDSTISPKNALDKVGVKTTVATRDLDINGLLRIRTLADKPEYTRVLVADLDGNIDSVLKSSFGGGGTVINGTPDYLPKYGPTGNTLIDSLIFDSGAALGVKTNLPTRVLDVNGAFRVRTLTEQNTYPWVLVSDANGNIDYVLKSSLGGASISGTENYVSKYGVGGNNLVVSSIFDNGTNVGVKTATPSRVLDVNGAFRIRTLTEQGTYPWVLVSDANGNIDYILKSSIAGEGIIGTEDYIPRYGVGGIGLIDGSIFDNGTNLGVKTATPSRVFDVNGTFRVRTLTEQGAYPRVLVADANGNIDYVLKSSLGGAAYTVASESVDTTCYLILNNEAVGAFSPKSNTVLNFNATNGHLSSTSIGVTAKIASVKLNVNIPVDAGLSSRDVADESIIQFGNNLTTYYTGAIDSTKAGGMLRIDTRNADGGDSSARYTIIQFQTREAGINESMYTVPFQLCPSPTGSFIMDRTGTVNLSIGLVTQAFKMPVGAGINKVLTSDAAGVGTWKVVTAGTGTVTSVGLSLPTNIFTTTGSPVTTSGTLTSVLKVQPLYYFLGSDGASPPYFMQVTLRMITPINYSRLVGSTSDLSYLQEITLGTGLSMSGNVLNATTGGGGTVTSVDISMPAAEFAVANSPITGAGIIQVAWNAQPATYVFAAPKGIPGGTPTFRKLAITDLDFLSNSARLVGSPSDGEEVTEITLGTGLAMSGQTLVCTVTPGTGTVTSVGLAMPPAEFTVSNTPVINAGTFSVSWNTQTNGYALIARGFGVPQFSQMTINDIAAINSSKLVGTSDIEGRLQEITLGTNLSMSGNTLNAAGGQLPADIVYDTDFLNEGLMWRAGQSGVYNTLMPRNGLIITGAYQGDFGLELRKATTTELGGVIVGSGLTVTDGVISATGAGGYWTRTGTGAAAILIPTTTTDGIKLYAQYNKTMLDVKNDGIGPAAVFYSWGNSAIYAEALDGNAIHATTTSYFPPLYCVAGTGEAAQFESKAAPCVRLNREQGTGTNVDEVMTILNNCSLEPSIGFGQRTRYLLASRPAAYFDVVYTDVSHLAEAVKLVWSVQINGSVGEVMSLTASTLKVPGAIMFGTNPLAGTIRYDGNGHFYGRNATAWVQLDN